MKIVKNYDLMSADQQAAYRIGQSDERAKYVNPNCVWADGECIPDCPTCKYLDESYDEWCRAHSAGMLEGLALAESAIYEALNNNSDINAYGAYLIIKDLIKKANHG